MQMYADQKVNTPLILCCADNKNLQELMQLGDAGFSLSDASKGGLTPLHCAARHGCKDICKHRWTMGAIGILSIFQSAREDPNGHVECASLIAEQQLLQPGVCDKLGRSALHVLAETHASADISDSLKALV